MCVLCGGRYARKQGLDKHMKKCVSKKDEQIKCTLCDKTFSESKAMDLHRLWHLWKFGEEMNSGSVINGFIEWSYFPLCTKSVLDL